MAILYSDFAALKVALDGAVLTIKMDSPPLNSMTAEMHEELTRIWTVAGQDPRVRVIVFTGAGDRAFSAGGNLNDMLDNWGNKARWQLGMAESRAIIVGMLECPKPIISRINGAAIGLGLTLALAGDITVAVDDGHLADPHVSVGLATGDGGALLWANLLSVVEARRHLLTGLALTGAEAAAKGLITQSVPRDGLDAAVAAWVAGFLEKSPSAVQTTKLALNLDLIDKAKRYMGEMLRLETRSWESPNHPEAVRAMIEKRAPSFIDE